MVLALVAALLAASWPVDGEARLCVRYARALTDFAIFGDAWTWWEGAEGRYERGSDPSVGSVLVFRRTPTMRRGHVAVVSGVVDSRTVLVDHSWDDGDDLHRGMRVVDTSPDNDWSRVRVWSGQREVLGIRQYATYGFIYPGDVGAERGMMRAAVTPRGRSMRAFGWRGRDADRYADYSTEPASRASLAALETERDAITPAALTPQVPAWRDAAEDERLPARVPARRMIGARHDRGAQQAHGREVRALGREVRAHGREVSGRAALRQAALRHATLSHRGVAHREIERGARNKTVVASAHRTPGHAPRATVQIVLRGADKQWVPTGRTAHAGAQKATRPPVQVASLVTPSRDEATPAKRPRRRG